MERCANTEALNRYLDRQEEQEREYEELLSVLRDSEPEEYEDIIASFGWGDADLSEIMEDLL